MLDLLIKDGMVLDGSGGAPRRADVGIQGAQIAFVEPRPGAQAHTVIDARGRCVTPGFIDTHAHSDAALLADPQHAAKLCQGVTTEILGQDGFSYAPLSADRLAFYRRYLAGVDGNPPIDWSWSSVAEFRSRFDGQVAVNTAYLVPHGTVRLEVLGMHDTPLVGDALRQAEALVARGLDEGAVGLSTGLSYFPGSFADTAEIVALARVAAAYDGVYVTHLRTVFRDAPFSAVGEALEIGRQANVPVHFSHFHTNRQTAGRVDELMAPIDAARQAGVSVTMETYPYPSGSGLFLMFLPPWVSEGTLEEILARLTDPVDRARILEVMPHEHHLNRDGGWQNFVISDTGSPKNRDLVGRNVAEAARDRRAPSPEALVCDLLVEEELAVGFVMAPPGSETSDRMARDVMQLVARPDYMVGSDSILLGQPHPRSYGCFPRLLGRFRRDYGGPALETLVNRVTALPAERFGLRDRGLLRRGYAADVVVFDAEALADTATYARPCSFPVGIDAVVVNGELAVVAGRPTGVLKGRALARGAR